MQSPNPNSTQPQDNDADDPTRATARNLFWQGVKVAEIARHLGVKYSTVDAWKRRGKWAEMPQIEQNIALARQRLNLLFGKLEDWNDDDRETVRVLQAYIEHDARVRKYHGTSREEDLNPAIAERNAKRDAGRKKKLEGKNFLSPEDVEKLEERFLAELLPYQRKWWEARNVLKERMILKSRQIGATWHFAREAIIDALQTGDNQIFLSASKAQALVFREYIVRFVQEVTGVVLTGTPIKLALESGGATLYFLGTNNKTAQSYHGHLYVDECAWIPKFAKLNEVASGMASHEKWRICYFSTPSAKEHDFYKFWTGETYNEGRPKDERVEINVSHGALKDGVACQDGRWRHIVTVEDAAAQGCTFFNLENLRKRYNDRVFKNLFLCEWVDGTESYFTWSMIKACMVDAAEKWTDWKPAVCNDNDPLSGGPLYDGPVWIGYDPARTLDGAAISVIAPPVGGKGKYRLIASYKYHGTDFPTQAKGIIALTKRYRVDYIGIDATTIGEGVFDMVKAAWPKATKIVYTNESKTRLVTKAYQIISKRQFEFDAGATDVAMGFLSIKKTMTASGSKTTFKTTRHEGSGHGDAAWSAMHCLDHIDYADFAQDDDETAAPVPRKRGRIRLIG